MSRLSKLSKVGDLCIHPWGQLPKKRVDYIDLNLTSYPKRAKYVAPARTTRQAVQLRIFGAFGKIHKVLQNCSASCYQLFLIPKDILQYSLNRPKAPKILNCTVCYKGQLPMTFLMVQTLVIQKKSQLLIDCQNLVILLVNWVVVRQLSSNYHCIQYFLAFDIESLFSLVTGPLLLSKQKKKDNCKKVLNFSCFLFSM